MQLETRIPEVKPLIDRLTTKFGDFSEVVPEGHGAFAVMGEAGDTKIIFDPSKEDEVDAARTMFETLRRKGYRAFKVVGKDGSQGEQADAFEAGEGRYIMVPQMVGG